jgi:hypothetical protein
MSGQELELETSASPERTEELLRNRELRQSEKQVWDACGKMRAGSHVEAWDMLQKWLAISRKRAGRLPLAMRPPRVLG